VQWFSIVHHAKSLGIGEIGGRNGDRAPNFKERASKTNPHSAIRDPQSKMTIAPRSQAGKLPALF